MLRKINFLILQGLVIAIPASLIFYYALNAGALADNDYWTSVSDILSSQGGFSTNMSDWLKRNNEHYVLLPKLVYAANIVITGGSNVGLSLFTWFMALLQVLMLYFLIPVKHQQRPALFIALLLAVAIFLFSPRHAHNWILGMSGTAWICANFFSLAAILALHYYASYQKQLYFWAVLVLSACALATYSTSLAVFPTLIIASFLLGLKRRDQILIVAFSVVMITWYLLSYSKPAHHPAIQSSLSALVTYIVAFMGALFNDKLPMALLSGAFGLISSVFMGIYIFRQKTFWQISIPWLCIQLYVCGNAAMAALARSGWGVEQAFSSRYSALPALFWLSWVMLASCMCLSQRRVYRPFALSALLVISSVIVFNTYRIGMHTAEKLLERAQRKSFALASIYAHAYDVDLLSKVVTPTSVDEMERLTKKLEANQHIPFNGVFEHCPKMGERIIETKTVDTLKFFGSFGQMRRRNDLVIEVKGWAYNEGLKPACLLLTNQDNIARGVAVYGTFRPDVASTEVGISSDDTGWLGYGKVDKHDKMIKAFMLTSTGQWVRLSGLYRIGGQPPYYHKI